MGGSRGVINGQVDQSVGTLVWVRRRNGSWWPGRILGAEELPGSHLLSPRSGTPVKLLGREDASVDWYNIEKSKRVKPFRCGEFDDCIERAKSVAGLPSKKREKYARREDAILHALELEKKQNEQKQLFGVPSAGKRMGGLINPADHMFLDDAEDGSAQESDDGSNFMGPESSMEAVQSVLSLQRVSHEKLIGGSVLQRDKRLCNADWEDDMNEATPRMRGLQDFGLKIASSQSRKANYFNSVCEGGSKVSLTENEDVTMSCMSKSMVVGSISNSAKGSSFGLKRKRSHMCPLPDENAFKRRDRRRPLTQVLESSVKLVETGFPVLDSGSKDFLLPFAQSKDKGLFVVQPNCDRKVALSAEPESINLESPSGRKPFEAELVSQSVCESKQKTSTVALLDKTCSNFVDHVNTNCCEARPFFLGSQMEAVPLKGSAFVDSLLRGSTCSLVSGSPYTGSAVSDTRNEKSSSISMASLENLSYSSNFQLWSENNIAENIYNRLANELRKTHSPDRAPWTSSSLPSTVKSVPLRHTLPMYPPHSKVLEDHRSVLGNRTPENFESSFLPPRSDLKKDFVKFKKNLIIQGPSSGGEGFRTYMAGEDEAESLQSTPALSFSSERATATESVATTVKHEFATEGRKGLSTLPPSEGLGNSHCFQQVETTQDVFSSGRNEGLDETGFIKFFNRSNPVGQEVSMLADLTVSKWQAKGRRNTRIFGKKSFDNFYGRDSAEFGEIPNMSVDTFEQTHDEAGMSHFDKQQRCILNKSRQAQKSNLGMQQARQDGEEPWARQLSSSEVSAGCLKEYSCSMMPVLDSEHAEHFSVPSEPHLRSSVDENKVLGRRVAEPLWLERSNLDFGQVQYWQPHLAQMQKCVWVDVPVKVQANYQGEHVPLVSLMSKLNGKAIVGHPVAVDCFENRFRDSHTGIKKSVRKGNIRLESLSGSHSKKCSWQPVWRTARRTAMHRVPRSCPTVVGSGYDEDPKSSLMQTGQSIPRVGYTGIFSHKSRLMRNSLCLIRRPSDKKISRRFLRKVGLSSQKTRTLSSIPVDHKVKLESTESVSPLNISERPSPTCIPVKLIFSRIKEVLYSQSKPVVLDAASFSVNAFKQQEPA